MTELIVEDRPDARWIRFNRPAQLNTLLPADLRAAREATDSAAAAGRPIVYSGVGDRAFSAGMNLDLFLSLINDPAQTRENLTAVHDLLSAARRAEVVTVAAINGHCLGAAFELALVCDFRIARPGALLGLPEMKLGLPCILDSAILQQYVGLNLAKEMILTGKLYDAEAMARHGLLRVLGEAEDLDTAVTELLSDFADVSRVGIAAQKRLFEVWQNEPLARANQLSVDEIVKVFESPETRKRVSAYAAELRGRPRGA